MNERNTALRFHDKNVVVIGASRGLGRSGAVKEFERQNATLVAASEGK